MRPPESWVTLECVGLSFLFGVRHIPAVRAAFDHGNRGPSMWIQLMFMDAACEDNLQLLAPVKRTLTSRVDFHIAMAMSIASANKVAPMTRHADWELRHLSHTLCLVSQRLSSSDATSDATLAAVAMIAQYERHEGRHEHGLLHMNGLLQLVNMRGGIGNLLRENIVLAQKLVR